MNHPSKITNCVISKNIGLISLSGFSDHSIVSHQGNYMTLKRHEVKDQWKFKLRFATLFKIKTPTIPSQLVEGHSCIHFL